MKKIKLYMHVIKENHFNIQKIQLLKIKVIIQFGTKHL